MIHAAKPENSDRLKRVLDVLKKGRATTREILFLANVCAVNTCISELRANGFNIECKQIRKGVFTYELK